MLVLIQILGFGSSIAFLKRVLKETALVPLTSCNVVTFYLDFRVFVLKPVTKIRVLFFVDKLASSKQFILSAKHVLALASREL